MRVSIFGPRDIDTSFYATIEGTLTRVMNRIPGHIVLLHGGAAGTQAFARAYLARHFPHRVEEVLYKPWHLVDQYLDFDTKYFWLRNKQIVDNSDLVIVCAYPDPEQDEAEYSKVINYINTTGHRASLLLSRPEV